MLCCDGSLNLKENQKGRKTDLDNSVPSAAIGSQVLFTVREKFAICGACLRLNVDRTASTLQS